MSSVDDNETNEGVPEDDTAAADAGAEGEEEEEDEDEEPSRGDNDHAEEVDSPQDNHKRTHTDGGDDDDGKDTEETPVIKEVAPSETPTETPTNTPTTGDKRKKRKGMPAGLGGSRKGRAPAVRGLTIPFRTVKKAMKLDPDIPIVQNEAAIMTTLASELFLKSLAKESHGNAKARGRNTIRYEDVAEARTKKPSLAFLETLLP